MTRFVVICVVVFDVSVCHALILRIINGKQVIFLDHMSLDSCTIVFFYIFAGSIRFYDGKREATYAIAAAFSVCSIYF